MVQYKILDNWEKKAIVRVGYFASAGGCLFVQKLYDTYGTDKEDEGSQHTISLGESRKEICELRDFLNSLNLGAE